MNEPGEAGVKRQKLEAPPGAPDEPHAYWNGPQASGQYLSQGADPPTHQRASQFNGHQHPSSSTAELALLQPQPLSPYSLALYSKITGYYIS